MPVRAFFGGKARLSRINATIRIDVWSQFSTTCRRWPTRPAAGFCLLLEKHELTVSELCAVLQTPQSSVSRHLKTLADDDWVSSRRDGTSRFYSMPLDDLDSGASRLWPLIREQVAADRGGRPGRAAAAGGARASPREVAGVLRHGRRRLGPPAERSVWRHVLPVGGAWTDRSRRSSSAIWDAGRGSSPRRLRRTSSA